MKVFLGGTCNGDNWRKEIIKNLKCEYFNPVVSEWGPAAQLLETVQKERLCKIHLYVITSKMLGCFSIAEAVDSVHNKKIQTIFQVRPKGFDEPPLNSLKNVIKLIVSRGGLAYMDDDLNRTLDLINSFKRL